MRAKLKMVILKELVTVEKEITVVVVTEHLVTQYLLENYILEELQQKRRWKKCLGSAKSFCFIKA